MKIVFSGGVGISLFLKKIIRNHNDIDIDVFGKFPHKIGLKKLGSIIKQFKPKFNGIYYEIKFQKSKIEIGYVQIVDFKKYIYNAGDGVFKLSKPLFLENLGRVGRKKFNIINPIYTFAEKLISPIVKNKPYREKDLNDLSILLKFLPQKDICVGIFDRYKIKNKRFVDVGLP